MSEFAGGDFTDHTDEWRDELARVVMRAAEFTPTISQCVAIADAILANPDVVLRALGATDKTSEVPEGADGWSLWWLPIRAED